MRLNKTDREEFRKRVKIFIPQMEKSEIVNHFKKKITQDNLCNTINRMKLGGTINDKRKTGRQTPCIPGRKNKLKKIDQ